MGKKKTKLQEKDKNKKLAGPSVEKATKKPISTLADLRGDRHLWYKTCVLVHDLRNLAKDKAAENRTLQTTDALYISAPYFTSDEATAVKAVTVKLEDGTSCSVEQAISTSLENFFEKRRASGDARPCGPHDMAPVYLSCFGIDRAELEDEKFISRLKRSGLGD